MKIIKKIILAITVIMTTACTGPGEIFEPRVYGVRQSKWEIMSEAQKVEAMKAYTLEQQRLVEQEKIRVQQEKLRLAREQQRLAREEADALRRARLEQSYNTYTTTSSYSTSPYTYRTATNTTAVKKNNNAERRERAQLEEAKRLSLQTYRQEQEARSTASWNPNEGQLVEAGRLVMDLQREIGRLPNAGEMESRLQSQMHLSRSQAHKILDELGLV